MPMDTTSRRHIFHRAPLVALLTTAVLAALLVTRPALAQEAAGANPIQAVTAGTSEITLAPGKYEWAPERSTEGPLVVVVSLPEQMAHVYRGGVRIGRSTVSSGRAGNDTPPGIYNILQKKRMHHSNLYNSAPMPFMQRLTWDGIALHAGHNPGYPASHGCIRLPKGFAEALFDVTEHGVTVVVADATTNSSDVLYPGDTVPVDAITGRERGRGVDDIALAGTPPTAESRAPGVVVASK